MTTMTTPAIEATADSLHAHEGEKQPGVLYMLFTTEMWERFSYYGMRAILVLYMLKALHFSQERSSLVYAWYTGLVYLTPLIGGWLADQVIGYRNAILLGGLVMAGAQFCLASGGMTMFYVGLGLLILGNGFFKPNISTIVGTLYREGDPRRDGGFTIFYMGINLGAFFSPIICGQLLGENPNFGYSWGFGAAGVGMLVGTLVFFIGQRWLGDRGLAPHQMKAAQQAKTEKKEEPAADANQPLTSAERGRVAAIFLVGLFTIFFWAAFEQAGNTMTIWADQFTERTIFGMEIKASLFQSVNPILIFILAPAMAFGWKALNTRGKEPSTPFKMVLGLTLLGLGFGPLVLAATIAGPTGKASMAWLLLAYLLHTIGELCLSPVGLSLVTKLAPKKLAALLMGVWFTAVFIGNFVAGYIGSWWEHMTHVTFFSIFVVSSLAAAALLFMLMGYVKKLMAGVH